MIDNTGFLLKSWIEKIETKLGKELWVPLYYSEHSDSQDIVFYSALVPESLIKSIIEKREYSWDLHIGDGRPGFNFRFQDGKPIPEYCQFGDPQNIQPLVIMRNFYGLKKDIKEIAEEFRLYFNLSYDESNQKYIIIKDDGDEEDVIRIEKNSIIVNSKYIKEFISAKKVKLGIFFDLVSYSDKKLEERGLKPTDDLVVKENLIYHHTLSNFDMGSTENKNAISSIIGKIYISGSKEFKPEYLPNTDDEEFEKFIIGIDEETGKEVTFSCNPSKLANYFGANKSNPQYVTPVFFDRKVLSRYYEEPSKYSIKDGYLNCGALWGARIDNNHDKYVIVFLGDLGRDFPESHRKYWRSFNVISDGGISEVNFRRSFMAEFTDPSSFDLIFKQRFKKMNEEWTKKYGWTILKELNDKDKFHLASLRIPLKEEQPEFDAQILSLTKILIDSINENEISKKITIEKGDEGITKLQKFFKQEGFKNFDTHISFLRALQELRSKGAAHRKSSTYEKKYSEILMAINIKETHLKYIFKELLKLSINYLDYLSNNCK